jgi:type IV pilus assembly protein PilY1
VQNPYKLVAIVGGGYDPSQDNIPYNTDDTGNRMYMIDVVSGELLWRAGPQSGFGHDPGANFKHPDMNNSIPADVRVVDLSGDGFADRMYAADTGGRVWRFDIRNGQPRNTLVIGGVFASLGAADGNGTSPQDARRFYYAPDVSMGRQGGKTFLTIAIGSGSRGRPLNTEVQDRFYGLRDHRPFQAMTPADWASWTPITDSDPDLVDATGNNAPLVPDDAPGWKLTLSAIGPMTGEKALAEARTFGGQVFFTTYTPNPTNTQTCSPALGTNRLYVVGARSGGVVPNRSQKVVDLPSGGIAPSVVFVFPSPENPADWDSNDAFCSGAACPEIPPVRGLVGLLDVGVLPPLGPQRTYWTQRDVDD